jgi:uncharacterized membrane protein YdbT with pleckstrin-like domain
VEEIPMQTFKPSAWQLLWAITRRYEIADDALTIRWGIVRRRHNRVPREKITNVDVSVSYLVPGTSSVRVNVGSGEPVKCAGLTKANARALGAILNGMTHEAMAAATDRVRLSPES